MAGRAWLCLMIGFGSSLTAAEPVPPARPLLIVHHPRAERWLRSLGTDLVQIEPFHGKTPVSTAHQDADWVAAEVRIRQFVTPSAFVHCNQGDDRLVEFWSDRLRNQGTMTIVLIAPSSRDDNGALNYRLLRESHAILVRLCPEARAVLNQRLVAELARQGALDNSLATLARQ